MTIMQLLKLDIKIGDTYKMVREKLGNPLLVIPVGKKYMVDVYNNDKTMAYFVYKKDKAIDVNYYNKELIKE